MRHEHDRYGGYDQCMICGYCNDVATVPTEIRESTRLLDDEGNPIRRRMRAPNRLSFSPV